VALFGEVALDRVDQGLADALVAQLEVDLQVRDQRDAGQVPPDQSFFGLLEPQVDLARGAAVQPGEEQHASALPLALVPVGEESAVAQGRGERIQVCRTGRPHMGLGHQQKLLFAWAHQCAGVSRSLTRLPGSAPAAHPAFVVSQAVVVRS
jgi:hypothetical protein